MGKRSSQENSAQSSQQQHSKSKKPRIDSSLADMEETNKAIKTADEESPDQPTITSSPAASDKKATRDPDFYFADGSVVLLVDRTLFKVHASLLKAQSRVFRDLFSFPSGEQQEGTDEHPIRIPGVNKFEFYRLMEMFYRLPSSNDVVDLQNADHDIDSAWDKFEIYSDVTRLAHRFDMADLESWAVKKLRVLLGSCAGYVSNGLKQNLDDDLVHPLLAETLSYSRVIQDLALENNIRNLIQYYYTVSADLDSETLLLLSKDPLVQGHDIATDGLMFMMLLNRGHETWKDSQFSRQDRIVFFAAQSYLTPLPSSLGEALKTPILHQLKLNKFISDISGQCSGGCPTRLYAAWEKTFDSDYYTRVQSREPLKATTALATLPRLRLEFAMSVRAFSACKRECRARLLTRLDEDMQNLFVKLASYNKDVEQG